MRQALTGVLLVVALTFQSTRANGGETAAEVLKMSGLQGGLVVHVGCGDAQLTAGLRVADGYLVHGLDTDSATIAAARSRLLAAGLNGKVTVDTFDGEHLPFLDNLVNLLVITSDPCRVSVAEMLRVVAPGGVVLLKGGPDLPGSTALAGGWKKTVKSRPKEMDDWPHYLRGADNNAVSLDQLAGPPRGIQWMATPLWTRHHDKLCSISAVVSSGGRLFYIVDRGPVYAPGFEPQWLVEARDAFSSVLLWSQPIKSWVSHLRGFRSGPVQIARLLVAEGEKLYVTMGIGEPVSMLDAATGQALKTFPETKNAEELILHDGVLLVVTGVETAEQSYQGNFRKKAIFAVDPVEGRVLWRWPKEGSADITPQTLAAAGTRVFLEDDADTVCLGLKDGSEAWRTATFASADDGKAAKGANKDGKKGAKKASGQRAAGWDYATLVVHNDVVLSCDGSTLCAMEAAGGKKLWSGKASAPFGRVPSTDILVIGDVVWASPNLDEGRNIHNGEVVKKLDLMETLTTAGHHHRCYRNKGIGEYIVFGHRGLDFFDTQGDGHSRNNWVRGACQYGILAANGLVYTPPNNCGCYPEALLHAFFGLRASSALSTDPTDFSARLEKGPAVGVTAAANGEAGDWPMYRRDPSRGGCAEADLPAGLKPAWTTEVGGDLTPPVIATGSIVVSRKDMPLVMALDTVTGAKRWTFVPGGIVDSTPTIHAGSVLFGSKDGSVYCVNLTDGQLRWRFRAAPADINTIAMERVESVWPVHGSILIKNGIAYFAAGRSSYLDGGIFLFGLDALTGQVKHTGRIEIGPQGRLANTKGTRGTSFSQNKTDYKTFEADDRSDAFSMNGNTTDIMVADASSVYLRHMRFSDALKPMEERAHHLLSTAQLIDDSEAHRAHWFYGNGDFSRLNVAYEWLTRGSYGGFCAPFGNLLVFDGTTVWGVVGHEAKAELFASDIRDIDKRMEKDFPADKDGKGLPEKRWKQPLPFHARALLKAGGALYVGGAEKTENILARKDGGRLLIASSADGKTTGELKLSAPPVFDGMAVAGGRLVVCQTDGKLVCLGK